MAFIQVSAPAGLRAGKLLSADNIIPERHIVVETLRNAAPRLGLTASVLATLDAMLSCLPPKRNHHTVFASNATLTFRRNGISDRTLRRHAAILQDIGLLVRRDSPNGKRFTKHNRHVGKAMRFGFDLTPLFDQLHQIAALAAEVQSQREQIDYLRCQIRAAANTALKNDPTDSTAITTLRVLRRKLSLSDCQQLLQLYPQPPHETDTDEPTAGASSTIMSGNDGQTVRHHHKSNKEHIDKKETLGKNAQSDGVPDIPVTVPELVAACPEAAQFALGKIETVNDVIAHGRTLAPMIGISSQNYDAAQQRLGALRTATTVWAIMQFHEKISAVGAYFRSITTGAKSSGFSPEKLVRRLARSQVYAT